jgi:hypothetical protein
MTIRKPRRGRGLKLVLILVAVALVLWCGYWFASNQIVAMAFARATASLAAGGRDVGCAKNTTGGFPLALNLDCNEVVFNDSRAGMAVALSRLTATAPLYWPGSVDAVVASPFTLEAPGLGLSIEASWTSATANVDAGFGGLNGGAISLDQLDVWPQEGKSRLPFTRLTASHAEASARPAGGNSYRFILDARDIAVKPKKGKELPMLAAEVDVTALDFGGSLGTDPKRILAAWLARGGGLEVATFALTLGQTTARATGALQVSEAGLISGELSVRLVGLDKLPGALEKFKPGSKDKVATLIGAVGAFTREAPDEAGARDAPVVIRDGVVMVGFIPVATIPALRF